MNRDDAYLLIKQHWELAMDNHIQRAEFVIKTHDSQGRSTGLCEYHLTLFRAQRYEDTRKPRHESQRFKYAETLQR